jgi:hypothetical protein
VGEAPVPKAVVTLKNGSGWLVEEPADTLEWVVSASSPTASAELTAITYEGHVHRLYVRCSEVAAVYELTYERFVYEQQEQMRRRGLQGTDEEMREAMKRFADAASGWSIPDN